jgi:hypothetical protein
LPVHAQQFGSIEPSLTIRQDRLAQHAAFDIMRDRVLILVDKA